MVYDDTFNAEFYKSLALFRMNLRMKLAAGANGGRKSNAKGSSVEFSDFREYLPGDDIRRMSSPGRYSLKSENSTLLPLAFDFLPPLAPAASFIFRFILKRERLL